MTPLIRFHLFVTVTTVAAMALILASVVPWLEEKQADTAWLSVLIGIGGSTTIYTGLAKLLTSLLQHVRSLKKLLLGKQDLQGTWIGMYEKEDGCRIYTVEYFEQDLAQLVITGTGFKSNGKVNGEWTSIASAIDSDSKKLIYAYHCDRYAEAVQFQGVCVFSLEHPSSTKRAMTIHGYSADFTKEARKTENREYRIDDDFIDKKEAFKRALELFGCEQGADDQLPARTESKTE